MMNQENRIILSGKRQVNLKMRNAFYTNDTRVFYPEQFVTSDFLLEDVLRAFMELEWMAKIFVTVDVYIDKNLVFSGPPSEYIFKYFNGKYIEHTACIRAELTPEYMGELKMIDEYLVEAEAGDISDRLRGYK